jgi:hypothetical protein
MRSYLYHSPSASASRPAVQPRWKTANCVDESNAVPLGSYYYNQQRPHQSLDGRTPADEVLN